MQENTPLISIIVPVYNAADYLKKCLDSILHQTLKEIEVICVNDGSTDDSGAILEEYAARDDRIILVEQENKGLSRARNAALKFIRGKYFMFVDGDDWIDESTCAYMYRVASTYHSDCAMFSYIKEFSDHSVVSHIFEEELLVYEGEDIQKYIHRRLFGPIGKELMQPERMDILVSACMQLFETEKYKNIRFFDAHEKIGTFEDGLYQMDVYGNCNRFVYVQKPFYHYRKDNVSSITSAYREDFDKKMIYLFSVIEGKLPVNEMQNIYQTALKNRVGISLIGIGLNQIHSGYGVVKNAAAIKTTLNMDMFQTSLKTLPLENFPLHWRVFFLLCKRRMTPSLTLLLQIMEFLRKRVR